MADKSFGVKEVNVLGSSGTAAITSPTNININSSVVGISTGLTVGGISTFSGQANFGVISASGNITGNSIIKSGGSSSQFLMADGSTSSGATPNNLSVTTLNVSGVSTFSSSIDANSHADIAGNVNVGGVSTALSFRSTDVNGSGSAVGLAIKYYVTSSGSSAYRLAGPGILNSVNNPTLYLHRGFTYIFENSTGGSHPFRIQFTGTSTGVGTYISGSQTGTQIFTIPHDAPANYEYQCTIHSGMKGSFIIPT